MDDLISRQAAIERFDYIRPRDPMTSDYTHGIDVGIALCKVAIREQPPAQLGTDCISRQAAISHVDDVPYIKEHPNAGLLWKAWIESLPSAQPKPISEEYAKAVECWLMTYQIKCAELRGRYTPYEILGWIVSDWRKDNEIWRFNQQTGGD